MSTGSIQSRISPPTNSANKTDFSAAAAEDPTDLVKGVDTSKTDFKTLITNSMDEVKKERKAKENGDLSATSEAEFLEKLADQTKEKRVPKNELGKDDFLKLFVTQLQNQDPLNPDDGTEMAAKLAQFNGLEQMMNVNKSLEKMLGKQNTDRNLQLVNYVGREVTIDGGRTRLKNGVPTGSEFSLDIPAAAGTLEVRDSSGILVSQTDLGARDAGTHTIKWDGKSASGHAMPDGVYTYSVTARNANGDEIAATLTAKAQITGVDVKSEEGGLYSDFGKIKFDQIRSVGRPGFDAEGITAQAPGMQETAATAPLSPAAPAAAAASAAAPAQAMAADAKARGTENMRPAHGNSAMSDELERMKAQGKLQLGKAKEGPAAHEQRAGASQADTASAKKAIDQQRSESAKLNVGEDPSTGKPNPGVAARPAPATQSAS